MRILLVEDSERLRKTVAMVLREAMSRIAEEYPGNETVESNLSPLIWNSKYRGRFTFVRANGSEELKTIAGSPESDSVFIVQPGTYGLEGKMIAQTKNFDESTLINLLADGLKDYEFMDKSNAVLKAGVDKLLEWESDSIEVRTADPSAKPSRKGNRMAREGRPRRPQRSDQ